jgi:hypothetical protein
MANLMLTLARILPYPLGRKKLRSCIQKKRVYIFMLVRVRFPFVCQASTRVALFGHGCGDWRGNSTGTHPRLYEAPCPGADAARTSAGCPVHQARRRSGSRERGRAVRPGRRKFTKTTGAGALRVLLSLFPETPQKNTLFKRTGKKKRRKAAENKYGWRRSLVPGGRAHRWLVCHAHASLKQNRGRAGTAFAWLEMGETDSQAGGEQILDWSNYTPTQCKATTAWHPTENFVRNEIFLLFFPPRKKQSPPNTTQIYISPKHSVQTPS